MCAHSDVVAAFLPKLMSWPAHARRVTHGAAHPNPRTSRRVPPVPAAATCASVNIANSNKSAGTGIKTTTESVAVAWSAGALRASLVRSRSAFAPVCCRRELPLHLRCSWHGVGALDSPCSADGYSSTDTVATCTGETNASTSTFVFAGCVGG